jgi:hypothetical protein
MMREWILVGHDHYGLEPIREILGRWAASVEGSSRSWRAFPSAIFRHSVLVVGHVAEGDEDGLVALEAALRSLRGFSVDPFASRRPRVA